MKDYYVIGNKKGTYTGEEPIYVLFSFVRFILRTRHYEHISDEINHGIVNKNTKYIPQKDALFTVFLRLFLNLKMNLKLRF